MTTMLALSPVYNSLLALRYFCESVLEALDALPHLQWVFLDNGSDSSTHTFLKSIHHPQLRVHFLHQNIGKGNALNHFIHTHLEKNQILPDVLFSVDSDIMFSPKSLAYLAQAVLNIPKVGFLSMRYTPNSCSPEQRLWLPTKKVIGKNSHMYHLKIPTLCNVAGGIIALPGSVLAHELGYELYPKAKGRAYYPDDAFLYDKLKKAKKCIAYLQGTEATHLRSAEKTAYPERHPRL